MVFAFVLILLGRSVAGFGTLIGVWLLANAIVLEMKKAANTAPPFQPVP